MPRKFPHIPSVEDVITALSDYDLQLRDSEHVIVRRDAIDAAIAMLRDMDRELNPKENA